MCTKWKEKHKQHFKQSNLDLFVSNLDHSQCNSCTAVRRGGNCSQAKNTIVFGLDNKRKKPCIAYKQSQPTAVHMNTKLL